MILLQAALGFSMVVFILPAALGLSISITHLLILISKRTHLEQNSKLPFFLLTALASYIALWVISLGLLVVLGPKLFADTSIVLFIAGSTFLTEVGMMYVYLGRTGELGNNGFINIAKTVGWSLAWYITLILCLFLHLLPVDFG